VRVMLISGCGVRTDVKEIELLPSTFGRRKGWTSILDIRLELDAQ